MSRIVRFRYHWNEDMLEVRAARGFLDSLLSPLPFYHEGFQMATSLVARVVLSCYFV